MGFFICSWRYGSYQILQLGGKFLFSTLQFFLIILFPNFFNHQGISNLTSIYTLICGPIVNWVVLTGCVPFRQGEQRESILSC